MLSVRTHPMGIRFRCRLRAFLRSGTFVALDGSRMEPVSPCQGRGRRRFFAHAVPSSIESDFLYTIGSSGRDCESRCIFIRTPVTRCCCGRIRRWRTTFAIFLFTYLYFFRSLHSPRPPGDRYKNTHTDTDTDTDELLLIHAFNFDTYHSSSKMS